LKALDQRLEGRLEEVTTLVTEAWGRTIRGRELKAPLKYASRDGSRGHHIMLRSLQLINEGTRSGTTVKTYLRSLKIRFAFLY